MYNDLNLKKNKKNKKISHGKVKSTETGLCRQKEQVAKVPAEVP